MSNENYLYASNHTLQHIRGHLQLYRIQTPNQLSKLMAMTSRGPRFETGRRIFQHVFPFPHL